MLLIPTAVIAFWCLISLFTKNRECCIISWIYHLKSPPHLWAHRNSLVLHLSLISVRWLIQWNVWLFFSFKVCQTVNAAKGSIFKHTTVIFLIHYITIFSTSDSETNPKYKLSCFFNGGRTFSVYFFLLKKSIYPIKIHWLMVCLYVYLSALNLKLLQWYWGFQLITIEHPCFSKAE